LIALVALAAAAISLAVALVVTLTGNGSSAASLRSMLASLPPGRYDPAGSYPGPDDDPVHPPNVILSHGNTYVLIPDFGYQFDFLASAHYGFFAYAQWLKRGDLKDRAAVLRIADWLVRKQQVDGRWLYEFPVTLDGATIGIPRPSAAAQGEAISLLERAFQLQHDRRYLNTAVKAMLPLERSASSGGVRRCYRQNCRLPFFEQYPTPLPSEALTGFMLALVGLYDLAQIAPPRTGATELYAAGRRTLDLLLPRFDDDGLARFDLSSGMPATQQDQAIDIYLLRTLNSVGPDPRLRYYANQWQANLSHAPQQSLSEDLPGFQH
jgi:hypothetical protein